MTPTFLSNTVRNVKHKLPQKVTIQRITKVFIYHTDFDGISRQGLLEHYEVIDLKFIELIRGVKKIPLHKVIDETQTPLTNETPIYSTTRTQINPKSRNNLSN